MLVIKTDVTYTVTHQTTHILPPAGTQNALDESQKKASTQQAARSITLLARCRRAHGARLGRWRSQKHRQWPSAGVSGGGRDLTLRADDPTLRGTTQPNPTTQCVYRAPCGGGAEKRNLLAPSPWCCKQRRATTAYRLPVPLGTPPLLNVWRLEPVKLPRARVTPHTGQPASHVSTQAWSARMAYRRSPDSAEARRPGKD